MNNTINIRKATVEDIDALVQIARESFYGAFAHHSAISPDVLKSYMDENYTVEVFSDELANPNVTYFVAETDEQLVGYAKLKRNSREEGVAGASPIQLCRLYNLQEFIGKGIGKALLIKCFEIAAKAGTTRSDWAFGKQTLAPYIFTANSALKNAVNTFSSLAKIRDPLGWTI